MCSSAIFKLFVSVEIVVQLLLLKISAILSLACVRSWEIWKVGGKNEFLVKFEFIFSLFILLSKWNENVDSITLLMIKRCLCISVSIEDLNFNQISKVNFYLLSFTIIYKCFLLYWVVILFSSFNIYNMLHLALVAYNIFETKLLWYD